MLGFIGEIIHLSTHPSIDVESNICNLRPPRCDLRMYSAVRVISSRPRATLWFKVMYTLKRARARLAYLLPLLSGLGGGDKRIYR